MDGQFFHAEKPSYDYKHIILVEGKDDAIVLDIILTELNANPNEVRVIVAGGKAGFSKHFPLILKSTSFASKISTISIIRDADSDPVAALGEIHNLLKKLNLPQPDVASFSDHEGKRFGVYLFPKPGMSGDLEDLALELADASATLSAAHGYIDAAVEANTSLSKTSKRKIQSYLAGASTEIRPTVGWAFKDGTITLNSQKAPELVSFLRIILDNH